MMTSPFFLLLFAKIILNEKLKGNFKQSLKYLIFTRKIDLKFPLKKRSKTCLPGPACRLTYGLSLQKSQKIAKKLK